jgi:hypothetical protein
MKKAILSAIEISSVALVTRKLARQKFPMAMLCKIAGARNRRAIGISAPNEEAAVSRSLEQRGQQRDRQIGARSAWNS